MALMTCDKNQICPEDAPASNYSSEGVEDRINFPCTAFAQIPPPLGVQFDRDSCVATCDAPNLVDACLCADRAAKICINPNPPPPGGNFFNAPQQCSSLCPDGGVFTATVEAGIFVAGSQAEADAQAESYACILSNRLRFCLGALPRCVCFGVPMCSEIGVTDTSDPIVFSTSGTLPTGLVFTSNLDCAGNPTDATARLKGTPTVPGTYLFNVIAVNNTDGSSASKTFFFSVIEIADASLPDFTIGTPYSYQLTAVGGSGHYAWKISSGTLPPGLTMSLTGLISGTPTGGTSGTLTFDVIDTDCAQTDRSFFPPAVAMTTLSTTRIATVIGYPGFTQQPPNFQGNWDAQITYGIGDSVLDLGVYYVALANTVSEPPTLFPGVWGIVPPKRYHNLTWNGTSDQTAINIPEGDNPSVQIAHAHYDYTGTGSIDTHGNQVSTYSKLFSQWCPDSSRWPRNIVIPNEGPGVLKGYCFDADPNTCQECFDPAEPSGDVASNSIQDWSDFVRGNLPTLIDQTHFNVIRGPETVLALLDPNQVAGWIFPTINDITGPWCFVTAQHNYTGTLDTEYTDSEALSVAVTFNSLGNTSETTPRTTGYTSRFTSVVYVLNCTNLVVGQDYTVRVQIYNTRTGASSIKTYSFTAFSTTNSITDSVPMPVKGQPLQVRNPVIDYTP